MMFILSVFTFYTISYKKDLFKKDNIYPTYENGYMLISVFMNTTKKENRYIFLFIH